MRVVNVRHEPCTHYIARGSAPSGRPTGLGNPFKIGLHTSRAQAIEQFEVWARHIDWMLNAIRALPEDAVLGCWCRPLNCHGDVVMKIWKELHGQD